MDAQARWFPEGTLADLPNIEAARESFPILGWELNPAMPCAFTCSRCMPPAASRPRRRRVFSVRFMGDDITHAPRRWRTSPEFPGLAMSYPRARR